jgi:FAD/FMN-containing dehydrogenase
VVYPTSAEDVSKIVVFAIANSIEIAVVGGGHSANASSSTDGGICINLSKMRACTVNVHKKTVHVQGGALWRDVDEALSAHGLAAVGGTVNHTGGIISCK